MARKRKLAIEIAGDYDARHAFKAAEDDADRAESKFAELGRKLGRAFGVGMGDEADKSVGKRMGDVGTKALKAFGKSITVGLKPIAATAAAGFAAQFAATAGAGLAAGAAKIAHGLGAAVALAPAAALAGVAAFGALKIAVLGVGDALSAGLAGDTEKFNEALEGLSPSARAFTREVVGLRGKLDRLKGTVQEAFFEPLVDQVAPLARIYLPQARIALSGIAGAFGQAASRAAGFLTLPSTARKLFASLLNVRDAVGNVAAGLPNLVRAFLPLVTVGSTFLPGLSRGFEGVTARIAAFMEAAERTGRLQAFIQGGIDKIRGLIDTAKQVGRILGNVGDVLRTVFDASGLGLTGGGGILDAIETATERVKEFLGSERGARLLADVWGLIKQAMDGVKDTVTRVFGVLREVVEPLLPQLKEFAAAFLRLKQAVIDVGLDYLEPVLRLLGAVLGTVVLPALTSLANWLTDNQPVLHALAAIVLTLLIPAFVGWAAQTAKSAIQIGKNIHGAATAVGRGASTAARGVGRLASGFRDARAAESAFSGKLGTLGGKLRQASDAAGRFGKATATHVANAAKAFGRLTVAAARTAGRVAVSFAQMAARAAAATARVVAQIAIQVARWVVLGIQSLLAAAKVALAWIISMGPIAIVIAAVIALVALIIANWDTVVAATKAAFKFVMGIISGVINWVRTNWPLLLAILTGPIGLAVLAITKNWDRIKAGATAVKNWIRDRFNDVLSFFRGLPGRVSNAVSGLFDGIKSAFKSAINAVIRWWNGLSFTFPTINIPRIEVFGRGIGGGTIGGWTVSTPNIPYLAEGGIATKATLAMLGEGRQDEAVLPLDSFWSRLRTGFGAVAGAIGQAIDRFASRVLPLLQSMREDLDHISNGTETLIRIAKIGAHNVRVFEDLASIDRRVRIPGFANGAVVKATPGGVIGRIGEGRWDEAVVPLRPGTGLGGPTVTENHFHFAGAIISSERDAERWVTAAIERAAGKGRPITIRGRQIR